jgi:8-oxo-dGTP pyrophosphatase MutT (NUDIX family)
MHLKIYFNDKPLFLCEEITPEIEPYVHHDDAVLIEELSSHAVNAMLHEMQREKVHAGVFLHPHLEELKKAIWKKFTVIKAAGGLVTDPADQTLFILRRGKWDLPKGKLEAGEDLETCAVREVEEETGLKDVKLSSLLLTTYHTYHESGKYILKESYWYEMKGDSKQRLVPQVEEDIQEIKWAKKNELKGLLSNSFPSIIDVVMKKHGPGLEGL